MHNVFHLFIHYFHSLSYPAPFNQTLPSFFPSLPPGSESQSNKNPTKPRCGALPSQPLNGSDLLVQREDVGHGADGRDGEGVDLRVALGVVVLDVQEVGRGGEGRRAPVQVPQPGVDGRVAAADVADVALEVLNVDGIEAD